MTKLMVQRKIAQRQKENGEDDAFETLGVPTPGAWRIRCDPQLGKRGITQWWNGEWTPDVEEAEEYTSLISAVRNLEAIKTSPKGYLKPVIVEPSGGIYNDKDGKDPNALPIEPVVTK